LLSLALTSFLTGVTEPIEFTFMFLAPVLYAVHALATGLSMVVMNLLGVRLGFSFSAGLFDYVLNFSHAQRPLLLVPVGLAYSALYYFTFRFCIARFDLATPGRELEDDPRAAPAAVPAGGRGASFVAALGGAGNLQEVAACTTRLRLVVVNDTAIDEPALRRLGARGVIRPSSNSVQVVLGPIADQVAGEIRDAVRTLPASPIPPATARPDPMALLAALGGPANILELAAAPGRLLLKLVRTDDVDDSSLMRLGLRGVARPGGSLMHLLLPGSVADMLEAMRARVGQVTYASDQRG
jgi:PTS system N-acetylglucosamine-specific IIC component